MLFALGKVVITKQANEVCKQHAINAGML